MEIQNSTKVVEPLYNNINGQRFSTAACTRHGMLSSLHTPDI